MKFPARPGPIAVYDREKTAAANRLGEIARGYLDRFGDV